MRVKQVDNVLDWIEGWPFSISVVQGQLSPSQICGLEQTIEVRVCLRCCDVYLKHLRFRSLVSFSMCTACRLCHPACSGAGWVGRRLLRRPGEHELLYSMWTSAKSRILAYSLSAAPGAAKEV